MDQVSQEAVSWCFYLLVLFRTIRVVSALPPVPSEAPFEKMYKGALPRLCTWWNLKMSGLSIVWTKVHQGKKTHTQTKTHVINKGWQVDARKKNVILLICQFLEAWYRFFLWTPAILVHRARLKKLVRYMIRLLYKEKCRISLQVNQAPVGNLYQQNDLKHVTWM